MYLRVPMTIKALFNAGVFVEEKDSAGAYIVLSVFTRFVRIFCLNNFYVMPYVLVDLQFVSVTTID
jgi:hypothetical protein